MVDALDVRAHHVLQPVGFGVRRLVDRAADAQEIDLVIP